MFLLRSYRRRVYELKAISRHFLSLSKNHHSSGKDETHFSKLFCNPILRFDYYKVSGFQIRCHSTECDKTNASDIEVSSDTSDSFHVENLDVTLHSEEEVEHFRKTNNITIRGNNVPHPIMHFSELCLPDILKEVLREENYSEPTPIQSQGWPIAFNHRDMVGVSQTGSGKTLAYMLPAIVHAANTPSKKITGHGIPSPKVLVLGPTRELVQQILQASKRFIQASHLKGACAYGGASKDFQLSHLQRAEICFATPGRLLDYLDNQETSLKSCTYLVLDEADRMLDMGFEPQIREIIDHIPTDRQTLMWSATWPKEIINLAEDFLSDYIHVTVGDTELVANPNIQQNIYVVEEDEKFEKLFSLLTDILKNEQSKVLVFAETKRKVDYITRRLTLKGLRGWGIHGDCSQTRRDNVLRDFRRTTPSFLVATDIASRGLDISNIHHVVNYDFPLNIEDYIHRIGRTARGSACGNSHSFFTSQNVGVLKDLLSILKKANQPIGPELYSLIETAPSRLYKSHKRYNYNSSYGNSKMSYESNRMSYGSNRMSYGKNRMSYGKNRMSYDRNRVPYGKDKMSYVAT